MRILILCSAAFALLATPAYADHDHGKKTPPNPETTIGAMDHGNMDHSQHLMGSTMPADGAMLHHGPEMIGVNFGHAMTVDSITISTLTGEMIKLDISGLGKTDHAMVKAPELQPDDYIVDWRAKGDNGHIMSGSFGFTVEAHGH